MNGVLVIDKPSGLTSHDVVNRVRRILGQRSVGHLGTLDPLATGVLPLVVGSLTRLAQFYNASEKAYEGVIRFGFATDTYDSCGEPVTEPQNVKLSLEELRQIAASYVGVIEQMPPPFSAKKIRGVPAYKLARKRQEVRLKPVQVEIKEFEIIQILDGSEARVTGSGSDVEQGTGARFRARVASGTYMRAVAHEMGQRKGCGAHLVSLRRTRLGEFDISDAHSLEYVEEAVRSNRSEELFVHPRKLLPEMPAVTATEEALTRIRSGRSVNLPELSRARQVKVFQGQKDLIAIATRVAGTLFHPKIVLVTDSTAVATGQRK
jgi:tRNA pseudouridine55 synthase